MRGADPQQVSEQAKKRQRDEMGTLGSGNHYLEVQHVTEVYAPEIADGIRRDRGRHGRQHPLRLARAGPPDRHRIPEAHGDGRTRLWHRAARPRTGLRADRFAARAGLPRRDARGDQLRLANRQILTHLTREVFAQIFDRCCRRRGCRCCTTCRTTPARWRSTRWTGARKTLRASQGRDARVRSRASRSAGGVERCRPAGADRRQHGHGLLHPGRDGAGHAACVRLRVPRRGARDEPPSGAAQLARPARGRRSGRARHI